MYHGASATAMGAWRMRLPAGSLRPLFGFAPCRYSGDSSNEGSILVKKFSLSSSVLVTRDEGRGDGGRLEPVFPGYRPSTGETESLQPRGSDQTPASAQSAWPSPRRLELVEHVEIRIDGEEVLKTAVRRNQLPKTSWPSAPFRPSTAEGPIQLGCMAHDRNVRSGSGLEEESFPHEPHLEHFPRCSPIGTQLILAQAVVLNGRTNQGNGAPHFAVPESFLC